MGYFKRTTQQISRRFINRLGQLTPITYVGEGSLAKALLQITAEELGDLYAIFDFNVSQCLVSTAQGPALDALGAIWGVNRRWVDSPADQQSFYFYMNSSSNHTIGYSDMQCATGFTIPIGTLVSSYTGYIGDALSFSTKSDVVFGVGDSIHYVDLVAVTSDFNNNVGRNQLTVHNYVGDSSGYVYCTNPRELSVSTVHESDESYRDRIFLAVQSIATSNAAAIRAAALSVDHVRDVFFIERPYGPGTGRVLIDVDSPANESIALAAAKTAVDIKRPFGSMISVELAEQLSANISYSLSIKDGSDANILNSLVKASITSYINSLKIGAPLYVSQLIDRAMNVSTDIIDINISSISVGGIPLVRTKYKPESYQIIVPGTISPVTLNSYVY
jgi:uncharacterized phage protein gp47/JayE